jgi:tRNA(Glu) U13 pseudouridine synthase TruD
MESEAGTVTLSFGLGRGQFATAVLREIMEFPVDTPLEGDNE